MELLNLDNYDREKSIHRLIDIYKKDKNWRKRKIKIKGCKFKNPFKKKKKRKERKRKIIRSYKTYILSDLWKDRKNRYFRKYGRKCEICRSPQYVTLHHATYRQNYGQEPDEEVFAFCRNCHQEFHNTNKTKKDMLRETLIFIELRKAQLNGDIGSYPQEIFGETKKEIDN